MVCSLTGSAVEMRALAGSGDHPVSPGERLIVLEVVEAAVENRFLERSFDVMAVTDGPLGRC